jgi:hypothetical protein
MGYGRIGFDCRALQQGRASIRPVLTCINDFITTQRTLQGQQQPSVAFGKINDCSFLIDRAIRQHYSRLDFECGRTLVGPWANSLIGRTQERYAKICGYTERLRHICGGWQHSQLQQPGTYINVVDNADFNYTCQLLAGQCSGLEYDDRDIYTKTQQVSRLCGMPAPATFLTPAVTYKWPQTSISYRTPWYKSPTSLTWIGKHVNYGGFSPFPSEPKTWKFPKQTTIIDNFSAGADPSTSTSGVIIDRWDPPAAGFSRHGPRGYAGGFGSRWV